MASRLGRQSLALLPVRIFRVKDQALAVSRENRYVPGHGRGSGALDGEPGSPGATSGTRCSPVLQRAVGLVLEGFEGVHGLLDLGKALLAGAQHFGDKRLARDLGEVFERGHLTARVKDVDGRLIRQWSR